MTIDIREKERSVLEMAAYVQSINIALTPVIPTIAVIVTFLVHIGLGYELSPAEVRELKRYLLCLRLDTKGLLIEFSLRGSPL